MSAGQECTGRTPVMNVDLVEAIHAAEASQAKIDAQQYEAFLNKVKALDTKKDIRQKPSSSKRGTWLKRGSIVS